MALNAFLSINHLKQMQKLTAATFESSMIQVDISRLLTDLTDMETGQRGYLLTENPSYLKPYIDAKGGIETDSPIFAWHWQVGPGENDRWNRNSSLRLVHYNLTWSTRLIYAYKVIASRIHAHKYKRRDEVYGCGSRAPVFAISS
jgi:hypothetical protein